MISGVALCQNILGLLRMQDQADRDGGDVGLFSDFGRLASGELKPLPDLLEPRLDRLPERWTFRVLMLNGWRRLNGAHRLGSRGGIDQTRFQSRVHLQFPPLCFLAIPGILVNRSEIGFLSHCLPPFFP
jgi:hypothetical protein